MLGLRINLEAEGYDVLTADDGERALALARSERPDLVILDVMLPKLNGFQVLQTMRREGLAVPVIVLSARTGEMDKVTGLELGAEDYVPCGARRGSRPPRAPPTTSVRCTSMPARGPSHAPARRSR
jgi:DNA-binding response OmpR family regulator